VPRFEVQEETLALQPAGVAGELAAPADDAVARDDHRERVAADGVAHPARQRGVTERAGELAVGRRLPVGDPVDEVPDVPLERVARGGGRQVEARALTGEVLGELVLDVLKPVSGALAERPDSSAGACSTRCCSGARAFVAAWLFKQALPAGR